MPGLTKQQQAALVLNKNLSVTAGAGSGKTKILVDRFLKIVTINSGKVRRVLAITFTKKAAAEMLERITSEINHRMADAKDQKTQKNYLLIRDQLNNAAVSTIHSFCAKILREFPFEAGLPPDFSEMDEMQAIVIRQQAIDRVFSWLDEVEESKRNTLAQLFNTLTINNIRKMLHQAMALPYEMGLIQQHYNRTTEDQHLQWLENIWLEKVKPILSPEAVLEIKGRSTAILEADNHAEKNEKALGVLNQLRNLKEHSQYDPDSLNMLKCVINLIKKITNNSGSAYRNLGQIGGKKSWSAESGDLLIQLSAYCESYASQLIAANAGPPPGESDKLWYKLINIFLELFARCNEYYQELKMDNGLVDFEDLQLYVFHLLHNHPDIANKLANRFDFIMVDEFQDTNTLQWLILEQLASTMDQLVQDKLFLVGDPKQSIYGFRNSDVRIFRDIKGLLARQAGYHKEEDYAGNIVFRESFRFLPQLNAFINTVFEQILQTSGHNEFEVDYNPLVTKRDVPEGGSVEIALLEEQEKESDYIAKTIKLIKYSEKTCHIWQDGEQECTIEFGDIAILIRSRTNLLELEQTLRQHDIPFKTVGGVGFWQRQEIYDFYHLLRFLDNPLDDLALVGLLRSPFFMIPDDVLFIVSRRQTNSWLQKLSSLSDDEGLNAEDRGTLEQVTHLLNKWLNLRGRIPLQDLLQKIIEDCGLRLTLAGELNGEQLVANMDKLIDRVRQFESAGIGGLGALIKNINELIEEEMREGEALINLEDQGTVKVMTIHAAKGLQFPVVFVPYLNTANARITQSFYIDAELGLASRFNDGQDEDHLLLHLLKSQKRKKELAEARRLFYVAVTRASNYLYLSAQVQGAPVKDSALFWLQEALQNDGIDMNEPGFIKKEQYGLNIVHSVPQSSGVEPTRKSFDQFMEQLLSYTKNINIEELAATKIPVIITDTPGPQVFSATRIMTYNKDPDEYYRQYHLGFFKGDYEAFTRDTYATDLSILRGKIVHRFFELLSYRNNIRELIEQVLFEYEVFEQVQRQAFSVELDKYHAQVMDSEKGREIIMANDFRNEVSVTMKIGNHFLTGTLDRIYKINSGSWEIIDYKTNSITSAQVPETTAEYLWQIKSYALLLSKLYPRQEQYPVSLYYLHPDIIDQQFFSKESIKEIEKEFEDKLDEIVNRYPLKSLGN